MTPSDIQKEWDSFIEYPERSNKMYVTTTSALLFAQHIADIAADKEREACAITAWRTGMDTHKNQLVDAREVGSLCAAAIRARGNA